MTETWDFRQLSVAIYLDALAQWQYPLLWPPERELARRDKAATLEARAILAGTK